MRSDVSARNLLGIWAEKSSPMFVSFKFGESGGSTPCSITELSPSRLRLSWQPNGELIISLDNASLDIADVKLGEVVSGASLLGHGESCLTITLPSGDSCLLVMMNPYKQSDT